MRGTARVRTRPSGISPSDASLKIVQRPKANLGEGDLHHEERGDKADVEVGRSIQKGALDPSEAAEGLLQFGDHGPAEA